VAHVMPANMVDRKKLAEICHRVFCSESSDVGLASGTGADSELFVVKGSEFSSPNASKISGPSCSRSTG
jgi:hypothetical protein